MDIGLRHSHRGYTQGRRYIPADVFHDGRQRLDGVALALAQEGNSIDPAEWHLHQDFAITLGLRREGNIWVSTDENYVEVARLILENDRPVMLEVRAEHLKDYLCARRMGLLVSSYRSREEILAESPQFAWSGNPCRQLSGRDRWEGTITEIHEGGSRFGSSVKVFHVGRTNVDFSEDMPRISPSDDIATDSWTLRYQGKKLVRVWGEFWRDEWVEPAVASPRVRGDRFKSSSFFITDPAGTRTNADDLEGTNGWLWFRPHLINQLMNCRGGGLEWYTRDTGGVRSSPATSYVHFGVNKVGLVNVFAKDLSYLPEWTKSMWAGFNVSPEGGVSEELLAAQAQGEPADTRAPESYLLTIFSDLNEITERKFGFALFRAHEWFQPILRGVHRFRSVDQGSFYALAKDLARLTADSFDLAAIQKVAPPPPTER